MTKIFEVVILGDVSIDYNKVQTAIDSIAFVEYDLIDDIDLIQLIDGIIVTWSSNDETTISPSGIVIRPAADLGNATVTLTATLSYNEIILEKDFVFTVFDLSQTVVYLGYYTGADDLTGEILKAFLHDLIDDHKVISYSALWGALAASDEDPNNVNNIILFYTGKSISKEDHGGDIGEWDREHIWARSHGDLDEFITDSDMHHIRPTDVVMNSKRAALDFDNGGTVVYDETIATDNYSDSDSWEPRDEVKGDVARMIFYMAVRYEGDDGFVDLELNDTVNNINTPFMGKLSILIEWHLNDLPDEFEIHRNDVIFTYQGNRNPFIDHPEFVQLIWGNAIE
ncbi:MAG: endonuclease [Candidatus Izimaplasma sp.]|nr:endonuclease [Candidatus Izimaplasma bacterium]